MAFRIRCQLSKTIIGDLKNVKKCSQLQLEYQLKGENGIQSFSTVPGELMSVGTDDVLKAYKWSKTLLK